MLRKNKLSSFLVGVLLASNGFAQANAIEESMVICSHTRKGEASPYLIENFMLYQDGTYNLAFVVKDASTNTVIKPLSAQYFGSFSLEGNNMYTRDFLKILNGDEVETANNSVWITASTARGFYWKINGNNGSISIGPHMATTNVYTECSGSFTRYLAGKSRAIADMLRQQKSAAVFKYGYKAFGR